MVLCSLCATSEVNIMNALNSSIYYVTQNTFEDSSQLEQMSLSSALKTEFLINNT
jgi:hypothetical protein